MSIYYVILIILIARGSSIMWNGWRVPYVLDRDISEGWEKHPERRGFREERDQRVETPGTKDSVKNKVLKEALKTKWLLLHLWCVLWLMESAEGGLGWRGRDWHNQEGLLSIQVAGCRKEAAGMSDKTLRLFMTVEGGGLNSSHSSMTCSLAISVSLNGECLIQGWS